jgi:predicted nucleotidyltransferase
MDGIKDITSRILSLDTEGSVKFIILYGSRSRDQGRAGSDIDICIYFKGDDIARTNFRRNVIEETCSDDVDVHMFQDLPLQIRKEVMKGKIMFSQDDVFLYDTAYDQIREFDDFKHRLYDYLGMERIK